MKIYLKSQLFNDTPTTKVRKFIFCCIKPEIKSIIGEFNSREPEWFRTFETTESAINYIKSIN